VSFVNPDQQKLILDLLLGRISEQEFFAKYPTSSTAASDEGAQMLQRALQERDATAVEFGLYLGHRFGITAEYLESLKALAVSDWHQRHEDVVAALAKLKNSTSVEALYRAAGLQLSYLEYDDTFALANKAVHALKAIGTAEAIEFLGRLLGEGSGPVQGYAKQALTRLASGASSEPLRSAATRLLGNS
jgi:HEAT repeat protein